MAPYWLRLNGGFVVSKKFLVLSLSLRTNSYSDPVGVFVPDLVMIETTACPCPYSVENELRRTVTSWTTSSGGFNEMLLNRSERT